MSSRRTVILLVAIVVGLLAAFLLYNYVRGIDDRAHEGAERIPAFRAAQEIPRGTGGDQAIEAGAIEDRRIPRDIRPSTSINSLDEIVGKVAVFDIAPGTVIVQDMFVDQTVAQVSFRQRLSNPEHTAIAITLDPTRAVGGWLQPNDEVNMLVYSECIDEEAVREAAQALPEADPEIGGVSMQCRTARYLYQDVQILAVGANVQLQPGETTGDAEGATADDSPQPGGGTIVLNVPARAAQWIASYENDFYLTLTPETYEPKAIPPLPQVFGELPGENENLLTPYCPDPDDPDEVDGQTLEDGEECPPDPEADS